MQEPDGHEPSLPAASNGDLYDEMFADGNRQLIDEVLGEPFPDDACEALVEFLRRAVMFSSSDPVRHELLFQRPVPGFEPSATSYAVAEEFYRSGATLITAAGITERADVDLFTAIAAGLSNQQVANDPGGDRWARARQTRSRPVPGWRNSWLSHHNQRRRPVMTTDTVCDVSTITRIDHKEAMAIAAAEIGGQFWWDGMNQLQVRDRSQLPVAELLAEWEAISVKAVKARSGMPRPIAALPLLGLPQPVGCQPIRYFFDVGFTRDVWAHRIDIAHATSNELDLHAAHDGRILGDYIAEWAGTHGKPFVLELSASAGGTFESGIGGERVEMDAIEFVRILAEHADGPGVLEHKLPL